MPVHTETAPAKINLGLKIVARRPDGYHDILSLMQTLDLADRVLLKPLSTRGRTEVAADAADVPDGAENLAYRAVEAVREVTGLAAGVRVELTKRIPAGGGLGGGSSDAAAVIRGLNHVWDLRLSRGAMHALASGIGSDVPFFLRGGTAIARGRGELLTQAAWPDCYHFVLVDPGFRVSTAWAYGRIRIGLTAHSEYAKLLNSRVESGIGWSDRLLQNLENDFLPVVVAEHPEAADILSVLSESGAVGCSLSGTGATLYGVFPASGLAEAAVRAVGGMGYRCFTCRTVSGLADPGV